MLTFFVEGLGEQPFNLAHLILHARVQVLLKALRLLIHLLLQVRELSVGLLIHLDLLIGMVIEVLLNVAELLL